MMATGLNNPTLLAAMLTTLLPFVAFVLIMIFTRAYPRFSAGLSIAAVALSLLSALFLLTRHWGQVSPVQYTFRWVVSGDIQIPFGYLLDPVSLLMLVVVVGGVAAGGGVGVSSSPAAAPPAGRTVSSYSPLRSLQ